MEKTKAFLISADNELIAHTETELGIYSRVKYAYKRENGQLIDHRIGHISRAKKWETVFCLDDATEINPAEFYVH